MSAIPLLPCPFCGKPPTAHDDTTLVVCTNGDCGAHVSAMNEQIWNRRPPVSGQPTSARTQQIRVREAVDFLREMREELMADAVEQIAAPARISSTRGSKTEAEDALRVLALEVREEIDFTKSFMSIHGACLLRDLLNMIVERANHLKEKGEK